MFRALVLGDPVAHSRSPAIHTAALRALGMDGEYRARQVDDEGMRQAVVELREGVLDGANVTMPHKALAAALADAPGEEVRRMGAANTLRCREGRVEAINTDVGGLSDAAARMGIPETASVLVLGSGGSAAAAVFAFWERGVSVSARRPESAEALLERMGIEGSIIPWGRPVEGAVVVNATPVGMEGEQLPEGIIEAAAGLIDVPYASTETPACRLAGGLGIPRADGVEVLVAQAARSLAWWTNRPAPIDVMRAAARV